ncbi:hypothetical protein EUGRSUZ_D01611 [Eucalyptus grandis]|uniref:Uncharacterized protein n=2 Tax=Eucalyptus grandis TaxID=71139 RepID=A0ACC3KWU3_EUCGR|nr:hypothetical protein EUGRSUZ_D01611 [Eucalyptus grandis]
MDILELIFITTLILHQHGFSARRSSFRRCLNGFPEPSGYLHHRRTLNYYRVLIVIPSPSVPIQPPRIQRS